MSQVFFTSDTHYGHANVIKYSKRPFQDVDEMNEMMILNWNAVVHPGDLVYHLGDFAFTRPEKAIQIAKRLNGQKYWIFGNHDKKLKTNKELLGHFIWARPFEEIRVSDQKIVLCHYAMLTWNGSHRGSWALHGHSHGSLKEDPHALRTDVGVDCWGYTPVSFEALQKHMSKKEYEPIDHHGRSGEEDDE